MICNQIWVLLSQPLLNCHMWFMDQSSRTSTPSFSPVFLLGGNRISWLAFFKLSWHWERTLALSGSWFGFLILLGLWSLASLIAVFTVLCLLLGLWNVRMESILFCYLCSALALLSSILSDPLVCLSFIPAFLLGLRMLSHFLCGVLRGYSNLPPGHLPETLQFYCSNPTDKISLNDLQAYKDNPAHVLMFSDSFKTFWGLSSCSYSRVLVYEREDRIRQ